MAIAVADGQQPDPAQSAPTVSVSRALARPDLRIVADNRPGFSMLDPEISFPFPPISTLLSTRPS